MANKSNGVRAYIDTLRGLLPCVVERIYTHEKVRYCEVRVRSKRTLAHGYKPRETLCLRMVVPTDTVMRGRGWKCDTILRHDWADYMDIERGEP